MLRIAEVAALARADALGAAGLGTTSPNPSVGCVLLSDDGAVIAEGATEPPPGRHAEVVALASAGAAARGATAVVTLEPCRHEGRTPPCVDALITAGVARLVYAAADPHAEAGGGAQVLAAAGIDVEAAGADAAPSLRPWLTATRRERPYVTLKTATTLDGRVAAPDGSSRWITGPAARADGHRLRARVDAVVVGSGTVVADDPALTVRDVGLDRLPLRVVVDRRGRTPADARVRDASAPTLITGAEPAALLADLFALGVRHVLIEGGPTLAGAFVGAGLVDEFVAYIAPALLGAGPSSVVLAASSISDAVRLEVADVTAVGPDVRVTARWSQDTTP